MTKLAGGIGLLGGSFDPVHNGHLAIAESFLASGYISELWILLTPDPPHKPNRSLNGYEHRLAMLRAAFQEMPDVQISTIESELPRPSYTIQTLQHLSQKHPEKEFYLCLGGDSALGFKQWKEWQGILNYCELLVARRPSDHDISLDLEIASKAHFIDHEPIDISSTEIRSLINEGEDVSPLIPKGVFEIIETNQLYKQ